MRSRVEAPVHCSSSLWWSYHYDPYCWVLARHRIRVLLLLRWMRPTLVPSRMGVLRRRIAKSSLFNKLIEGNPSCMRDYTSLASPLFGISTILYFISNHSSRQWITRIFFAQSEVDRKSDHMMNSITSYLHEFLCRVSQCIIVYSHGIE